MLGKLGGGDVPRMAPSMLAYVHSASATLPATTAQYRRQILLRNKVTKTRIDGAYPRVQFEWAPHSPIDKRQPSLVIARQRLPSVNSLIVRCNSSRGSCLVVCRHRVAVTTYCCFSRDHLFAVQRPSSIKHLLSQLTQPHLATRITTSSTNLQLLAQLSKDRNHARKTPQRPRKQPHRNEPPRPRARHEVHPLLPRHLLAHRRLPPLFHPAPRPRPPRHHPHDADLERSTSTRGQG